MSDIPRSVKAPITISEYIETQRAHGSCTEELKATVAKCTKAGLFLGLPCGIWVGYAHRGIPTLRTIRPFLGHSIYIAAVTTLTFGGLGAMIGSYNCLRVVRD
ncbi:unnamed protein product [Bursaphelenchus xylophilus]|uniref:(pine wood nematode) hypothetical protein n=1 Tax=Bursaphelenchus xylophilus TaxID=6326 RepID=A0A1I7SCQ4_BURXY|nr:unnamed protein product [Bursaphelenchus xylophilus]CAG9093683.1 unnamed protein product [Bursaphelenchus xylophilus]